MTLLRSLDDALLPQARGGVVSIGNFDGVHVGHARLVERLQQLARRRGTAGVIFTFDPHPAALLRPERVPVPLTTLEERAELLCQAGADFVIAYPTDRALLSLLPEEFFQQIVVGRLRAAALVEGPNFRFGRDRAGDVETLSRLARQAQIELVIIEPSAHRGQTISSSWLRDRLLTGEVQEAAEGLGRPYSVCGIVARGVGRGQQLGFPTANLAGIATLIPADGVYAARASIDRGIASSGALRGADVWPAAVNVGPNPTFGESVRKVEAHLIGFARELYGKPLRIEFLARLRDTRAFASADDLSRQLRGDVERARREYAAFVN